MKIVKAGNVKPTPVAKPGSHWRCGNCDATIVIEERDTKTLTTDLNGEPSFTERCPACRRLTYFRQDK